MQNNSTFHSTKFVLILVIVCSWFICELEAIAGDMPKCVPNKSEFPGADINTQTINWSFKRDAGEGGENYGGDYWVTDPDNNVLVQWEASENSCISCTGGRDVRMIAKDKGAIRYPAGVHTGVRIDTGKGISGPGGSYTGVITMSYVPYTKWKQVFVEKYLECK